MSELSNANWQIKYMCDEIGKAVGITTPTPSSTVDAVRQLKAYADQRDEQLKASRTPGPATAELVERWKHELEVYRLLYKQPTSIPTDV